MKVKIKCSIIGLSALIVMALPAFSLASSVDLAARLKWSYQHDTGSEIAARDKATGNLWVTNSNGIDILDTDGNLVSKIDVSDVGSANSVAIRGNLAAVAVAAHTITDPGQVIIYNTTDSSIVKRVTVGANPDMVKFAGDGRLLVANEGEPEEGINPEGSISIIDPLDSYSHTTVGFTAYNGQEDNLRNSGVRIFDGISAAVDFEPEYIAVSGNKAYVTLQENNSLAIINLNDNKVEDVVSFGTKDHSLPGNGLDTNDKDDLPLITPRNVQGMYMPDAIDAFVAWDGKTYLITANEGDARNEDMRIKDAVIDPSVVTTGIERLEISTIDGDWDGDGDIDLLHSYGARSFSIWNESGELVWDSGDAIERLLSAEHPELWQDGRSDNKGPEPEGVALLDFEGNTIVFIGLERINATMTWDITDPFNPEFLEWIFFEGDEAPEGLLAFQDGLKYWLAIANEESSTTSLYELDLSKVPEPASLILFGAGLLAIAGIRRR